MLMKDKFEELKAELTEEELCILSIHIDRYLIESYHRRFGTRLEEEATELERATEGA